MKKKKQISYLKLESCGGCINSLLTNKHIFEISEYFEINEFDSKKDFDLLLIEGCIFTDKQKLLIEGINKLKKPVVYFGSCSISPKDILGIDVNNNLIIEPFFKIHGCPVSDFDLYNFLKEYYLDIIKNKEIESICKTCQENEIKCIKKEGITCNGEITKGPCEIICPKIKKSCLGCKTSIDV